MCFFVYVHVLVERSLSFDLHTVNGPFRPSFYAVLFVVVVSFVVYA